MKSNAKSFSLMGILNVTPDSFYDGGRYAAIEPALEHARVLQEEGAHSIDIGGVSTRPGAAPVSVEEECARLLPVVVTLVKECRVPLSIDTTSSVVAHKALEAGAAVVNDISAGRFDPDMPKVIADYRCKIVLMHSRGTPRTMMQQVQYTEVAREVADELYASVDMFCKAGVVNGQIIIDPGIGFAKTAEQNIVLLGSIETIVAMGFPVLLGTSRKSFIGDVTGRRVGDRLYGSLGSIAGAYLKGVAMFRVHDVAATADFLKVMSEVGYP